MRITLLTAALFASLLLLSVAGCSGGSGNNGGDTGRGGEIITTRGTVQHINLEGGFYGIIGDNGGRYNPLNLPAEHRQDGARVLVTGKIRNDVATFQMWGDAFEITSIEKE